jgi:hypothetical protein
VNAAHLVMARIRQLYAVEADAQKIIKAQGLSVLEADALRRQLRPDQALPMVTAICQ